MHVHYRYGPLDVQEFIKMVCQSVAYVSKNIEQQHKVISAVGKELAFLTDYTISTNEKTICFSINDSIEERNKSLEEIRTLRDQLRRRTKRVKFLEAVSFHSDGSTRVMSACDAECILLQELGE